MKTSSAWTRSSNNCRNRDLNQGLIRRVGLMRRRTVCRKPESKGKDKPKVHRDSMGKPLIRETAASILVGWYLLAPPVYTANKNSPTPPYRSCTNMEAPLSAWTNWGGFDSANACQWERAGQIAVAHKLSTVAPPSRGGYQGGYHKVLGEHDLYRDRRSASQMQMK